MDFKQLEYILTIAEERNITKAANRLFMTQSALNQQLLKLERELDTPLFHRTRNSLFPTQAGNIYIENAREILMIKKNTYGRIQDILDKKQGQLSIGFTPGRGIEMFASVYPYFHNLFPEILVEPRELSVRIQQNMIREGNLDLGFMTLCKQQRTMDHYINLCSEELFLAVPTAFLSAIGYHWNDINSIQSDSINNGHAHVISKIELRALRELPFVLMHKDSTSRALTDGLFREAGFIPNILFETSNTATILKMIASNLCCGFIPEYYRQENEKICFFSLTRPPVWDIAVCYRKGGYLSLPAKEFIGLAKDYFNQTC